MGETIPFKDHKTSVYPTEQQYIRNRNENKRIFVWSLCLKFAEQKGTLVMLVCKETTIENVHGGS
jgi:hypothetical protein